jgi:hypothetical protein
MDEKGGWRKKKSEYLECEVGKRAEEGVPCQPSEGPHRSQPGHQQTTSTQHYHLAFCQKLITVFAFNPFLPFTGCI